MNVKHFIEEKILLFEFTEELDHHESEKIRRRVDYEIQRFIPKRVIFDFDRVVFMDSAGIGLIIGRYKLANMLGGKVHVTNMKQSVRKIFEMSGMQRIISEIWDKKDPVPIRKDPVPFEKRPGPQLLETKEVQYE